MRFAAAFEDEHATENPGKLERDRHAGRTCADDANISIELGFIREVFGIVKHYSAFCT
jgi:hypothetical protein